MSEQRKTFWVTKVRAGDILHLEDICIQVQSVGPEKLALAFLLPPEVRVRKQSLKEIKSGT